ncbi:hypothetical protein PMAYCL1PPCAC_01927, partial [Pristionchus mayeri]
QSTPSAPTLNGVVLEPTLAADQRVNGSAAISKEQPNAAQTKSTAALLEPRVRTEGVRGKGPMAILLSLLPRSSQLQHFQWDRLRSRERE